MSQTFRYTTRGVLLLSFMLAMLLPGQGVRADAPGASAISQSSYPSSCGAISTIYYKNQFALCYQNWAYYQVGNETANPQATCYGGNDQIAVGTGPGSDNFLPWTNIVCNGSFVQNFTSNMIPGDTYYLSQRMVGWTKNQNTAGITLENTKPTITDNEPDAWYSADPGASFDVQFSDNGYLLNAQYMVYSQAGMTGTLIKTWTPIFTNLDASSYNANGTWTIPWTSLLEGDNYVSVKVWDAAGNIMDPTSAPSFTGRDIFTIKKDVQNPTHSITSLTSGTLAYVTTGTTVSVNFSGNDIAGAANSGIQCFTAQYKDVTAAGSWTDIYSPACKPLANFAPTVPPGPFAATFTGTEGHLYYIRVQAKDNSNRTDTFDTEGNYAIQVDNTAPVGAITNPAAYSITSSFPVAWSATDATPGSGIKGYNLQYKKDAGAWTDWMVGFAPAAGTALTSGTYSGVDGSTYYFRSAGVDKAGNVGAYSAGSTGLLVDLTLPVSSVTALPTYTTSATFNVAWTGSDTSPGTPSGVACYDVQYRKDSGTWTAWQTCTAATNANFDSSATGGNGTYDFRVRAKDTAGNWEAWPTTEDTQTVVDTTPPVIAFVNDGEGADVGYTGSATTLKANWSASDPETGIEHYEFAIGTTSGGTDISPWTSVGSTASMAKPGLTLFHNTVYYVTIRAYNPAGLYTDVSSDGAKVDLVAPTTQMTDPNSPYMGTTSFTVTWSGADGAAESGLVSYTVEYKDLGISSWSAWLTDTALTTSVFNGVNGHKYQFRVRGKDAVGNITPAPTAPDYQVSTTVDTSNLSAPSGISDGSETDTDKDYTSVTNAYSGHWNAVTGAASYLYAVGTTVGGTNVVNWTEISGTSFTNTGLTLTDGSTYYLTVKAKNFSGTIGNVASSDGLTVDLTAPSCAVTALATYQGTVSFSVQWNQTGGPDASGIQNYTVQYRDGTVNPWTDWLTNSTLTSSLFPGVNGHTYYFQCRAKDNAGNTGAYPGLDGNTSTTVDNTMLPPPATIADGLGADLYYTTTSTQLSANWSAVPGAASYIICFGQGLIPNNCSVMNWTNVALATNYTKTGLSLTEGETYFVRIKAKNNSGMEGSPGNSDGVTVDSNPPGTPTVTDDGDYTKKTTELYVTWSATPGVSGIKEYQYAVGTTAGGTDVLGWTTNGLTTNKNITGLSLSNGITYYISVKAYSGSNVWSAVGTTNGITVDTVAPTCTVAALSAYQASNGFTVSWSAADAGSGLANLYDVKYRDGAGGVWTDWLLFSGLTSRTFNGVDGHQYYFQCRAIDNTGNWSAFPNGNGDTNTIVASSAPVAPTVTDGTGADEDFTTSATTLSATWNAVPTAVEYLYAIGTTPGGTELVNWTSTGAATSFTNAALTLVDGITYYVSAKGKNNAAVTGAAGTSDGILVDSSAPTTPVVYVPDTVTASVNYLEASWVASDPQSGITEYQVSVGTSAGATDVKNWYSLGTNTTAVISGLTLTHGSEYFINVKCVNNLALWSGVGTSQGVTVNTTLLPAPVAVRDGTGTDDAAYAPGPATLSANWDPVTNAASYDVAIGSTPGARDVMDWTGNGLLNSITKSGLTLVSGSRYYFSVRSRNDANVPGAAKVSNGVLLDTQKPGTPVVTDAGAWSSSASSLTASWTATPGVSGIASYKYAVGTTPGGTDALNWTSAGNVTQATISGLSLTQNTQYFISVKAVSNAGIESDPGTADGVTIDSVNPTCAVQALPQYTGTAAVPVVWSGADAESGLANLYDVQVRDGSAGAWADWLTSAALTTANYPGADEHTYFFRCRAKDVAGNYTDYIADGDTSTTVDTTVPLTPVVSDGTGADVAYAASADTLSANWPADADAATFQYAIGTTAGGTNVVPWTTVTTNKFTHSGLSLTDGTKYYVSVKGFNKAALASAQGVSNGVIADNSAPVKPVVTTPDPYSSKTDMLSGSWVSADPHSGVSEYQVSVGTTAGLRDIKDWTTMGASTTGDITGLVMQDGQTYFINVRAKNGAGTYSETGSSQGIIVDSTRLPGPERISIVRDGAAPDVDIDYVSRKDQLAANWTAIEGAARYEYAIGTAPGLRDVKDWTNNGTEISVVVTGLSLQQGQRYVFDVRGINLAEIPGVAKSSNGVTVDATPPGMPVVTDDGDRVDAGQKLHVTWSAAEPDSPIAKYEYAVGSEAGKTDIKDWTDAGIATSITDQDLELQVTQRYFVSVRATNAAGLTSEIGTTDGITAVLTAMVSVTAVGEDITLDAANMTPAITSTPPEGDADYKVSKEFRFTESNGVSVTFDQLKRSFLLADGTEISDPIESTSFKIPAGSDTKTSLDLIIPRRVITLAMGGHASAIIRLKFSYTGYDESKNYIETIIVIPIKLTSAMAEASFEVTSVSLTAPTANQKLSKADANIAKASVQVNGVGTLNGVWMLDGEFYKAYRKDLFGESKVVVEQQLPGGLDGEHTIQFRVTMPEVRDSETATFSMVEGEGTKIVDVKEFDAGFIKIKDVTASFDPGTQTYSGSGVFVLPSTEEEIPIRFVRLKISTEGGLSSLVRGVIIAEVNYSFENGPLKITVSRVLISNEEVAADGKVEFAGTDSLPEIGPFYFYNTKITKSGFEGTISLSSPQLGQLGHFKIAIEDIYFKFDDTGVTLKAGGYLTTVPEDIFTLHLYFGYSPDGPVFDYSVEKRTDWITKAGG